MRYSTQTKTTLAFAPTLGSPSSSSASPCFYDKPKQPFPPPHPWDLLLPPLTNLNNPCLAPTLGSPSSSSTSPSLCDTRRTKCLVGSLLVSPLQQLSLHLQKVSRNPYFRFTKAFFFCFWEEFMVCPIKFLHFGCDGKDWIHRICNF